MKFILSDPTKLNRAIIFLYCLEIDPEKPHEVVVKDFKKIRTDAQNKLYWSWLGLISKETGNSTEALHVSFANEFLPKTFEVVRGETVDVVKSTTKLTPEEFTKYLKEVEAETAIFFGIKLPHPGEKEWSI
jgi:hypothetical protein